MTSEPSTDRVRSDLEKRDEVSGWRMWRVGDLVQVINGYPFDSARFSSEGWPLIRIRDLNQGVAETHFNGSVVAAAIVTQDDVLVGMDGDFNVGRWKSTEPALLNQRMLALRGPSDLLTVLEHALERPLRAINDTTYATTVKHLSSGQVRAIRLCLPINPKDLRSLACFLDRETGEIDAFIRDQEELIGLLQERRDSSWQAAVDGMATLSAEMPLRRVIDSIVDGPFGSSLTSSHYSTEGARVIRLGNIGINRFKTDDEAYVPLAYFRDLMAHSVQPGDVVVAGLGDEQMPLGRAAVVPDLGPALVKADCFRVRPSRTVTSEFLAWILSAPQTRARMQLLARGSTRQRLNTAVVREVQIPVPSLVVQEETVSNWRHELREIDASLQDALKAVALSRERRSALVSAAMTGKIDAREHVGV
jgi:type I restriction enzyme S subunit